MVSKEAKATKSTFNDTPHKWLVIRTQPTMKPFTYTPVKWLAIGLQQRSLFMIHLTNG